MTCRGVGRSTCCTAMAALPIELIVTKRAGALHAPSFTARQRRRSQLRRVLYKLVSTLSAFAALAPRRRSISSCPTRNGRRRSRAQPRPSSSIGLVTLHRIAQHAPEGGVVERGRALVQQALPGRVQGQAKLLHAGSAHQGTAALTGSRGAQPPGRTWLMLAWSGRGVRGTRSPLCTLG